MLVDDDDDGYADSRRRSAMIAQGKISFRTCIKDARLPASHLIRLAQVTYVPSKEPHSFMDAVNHWLLVETLTAIGSHSMV